MSLIRRERLALKGRLAEEEQSERKLRLSIKGDIEAARSKLDPYADLADVDIEGAAEQILEAFTKQETLQATMVTIKSLKRDLGEA